MGIGLAWPRWRPSLEGSVTPHVVALVLVGAATVVGGWLNAMFPHLHPLSLYFPAVLTAARLGGGPPGVTALLASAMLGWRVFMAPDETELDLDMASAVALYLFAASFMIVAGARFRALIAHSRASTARLAERELRYRTLFNAISEGFALAQAVRDEHGKLVDYVIVEANPALLRMMNANTTIVGKRQSEILDNPPPTWLAACDKALKGSVVKFEYHAPVSGRWFEIHLSRVNDEQFGQFILDITDRKLAEARQGEQFDELNHRVKNNLAMVSSMLAMQARAADSAPVREHLTRAVDRIQTIADVHASLYRSSRKDDVDFAAYLQDLCARLSGVLFEDDRVQLRVVAEPADLPLDKAVALGVVVNELVTNAAKHAYPSSGTGVVDVTLLHSRDELTLTVADRGVGLPDVPSSGLGMRLVRSLVQQLGGTMQVDTTAGAAFAITIPASS